MINRYVHPRRVRRRIRCSESQTADCVRRLDITRILRVVLFMFATMILISVSMLAYNAGDGDVETSTITGLLSTAADQEAALETRMNRNVGTCRHDR